MQPKIFFYTTITLIMFTTNIMYGQIKHQITFPKNYSIKQEVLYDGNLYNQLNIPGLSFEGHTLNAGIFLYTLIADGKEVDTKKMILTKKLS